MTVREHLATEVTDLPEMTDWGCTSQYGTPPSASERITQLHLPAPITESTLLPEALPENITDSESNLDNSN